MSAKHSLSFVLLPVATMPSGEEFEKAWREILTDLTPPTRTSWDADSATLERDGTTSIVALVPTPIPEHEAEAAASASVCSFRDESFTSAPHLAHLIVTSTSESQSPLDNLLQHTRVVAAFAKAGSATGVYEGNAHATHHPTFYIDVIAEQSQLPVMLWNGISIARTPTSVEVLSLGMAQLDLPDILLVAPSEQAGDAIPFAFNLLGYVADRGAALAEGDTVGRTASEKLPVRYVQSPIDSGTMVMRVELPSSTKRWWHLWKS